MIIVTETRYLDGTGDVPKDIEYITANDYTILTGDNAGDLLVYKRTDPKPLDVTPGNINHIEESVYETLAHYRSGYYSKVTLKK